MDQVIAFLKGIRHRMVHTRPSGFRVMGTVMVKEVEEWFRGGPKPQDIRIEDLKTLKIITTEWELLKSDKMYEYKLKRKSNQKESTEAETK